MCLDTLVFQNDTRIGYKVFNIFKGKLIFNCQRKPKGMSLRRNRWIHDTNDKRIEIGFSSGSYQAGFHVFRTLEDAKSWKRDYGGTIFLVHYKNIVVSGLQHGKPVDVARSIKIIEEAKTHPADQV